MFDDRPFRFEAAFVSHLGRLAEIASFSMVDLFAVRIAELENSREVCNPTLEPI